MIIKKILNLKRNKINKTWKLYLEKQLDNLKLVAVIILILMNIFKNQLLPELIRSH